MTAFGRFVLCAILVLTGIPLTSPAADSQQIENLRAFTKLYGYVRFFHPSDEVAEADWWAIAKEGAARAAAAQDTDELRAALEETFGPVAPSLILERIDKTAQPPTASREMTYDPEHIVAWQHTGCGLSSPPSIYHSNRTSRPNQVPLPANSAWYVSSSVGGISLRSLEFRLRAAVRMLPGGQGGEARLYVGILDSNDQYGFWDSMEERPITDEFWNTYEITGTVVHDALEVYFGGMLLGSGVAWFDAFELDVREPGREWTSVDLFNLDFEQGTEDEPTLGWDTTENAGMLDELYAFEGSHSIRIMSRSEHQHVRLFDAVPGPTDIIRKNIGAGLRCELPLWLMDPRPAPQYDLVVDSKSTTTASTDQPFEFVAAVVVVWNALQHFYPYFDVVNVDWDDELTTALNGALNSQSRSEFTGVLELLIAALDDGHGMVLQLQGAPTIGWFPIKCDWVENQVIVTAALAYLEVGDVLMSIDGVPIEEHLEALKTRISGSPQRKLVKALYRIGSGPFPSTASVEIDRNGDRLQLSVPRLRSYGGVEPRPTTIDVLDEGIYYVDLSRATMGHIGEVIDILAEADGVVFDLRGYPTGNDAILSHLTDVPLRSAHWNVAHFIYPDQENIAGWDTSGRWLREPREPRFQGSIVFLTDARAISYAESVMGIVEHYELGEIVGRPTAGANGNVTNLVISNEYSIYWTGMKVLKHDGSQHHTIGIQPTVPVSKTIAAIREGRDEDIEMAVELIKTGT